MAAQLSSSEKRRKYRALLQRDGDLCFWCEKKFTHQNPYTLDHLVTQKDKGTNELVNLVLACSFCNNKRKAMAAGEFMAWIRKHRHSFPQERVAPLQHIESTANRLTPVNLEEPDEFDATEQNASGSPCGVHSCVS